MKLLSSAVIGLNLLCIAPYTHSMTYDDEAAPSPVKERSMHNQKEPKQHEQEPQPLTQEEQIKLMQQMGLADKSHK